MSGTPSRLGPPRGAGFWRSQHAGTVFGAAAVVCLVVMAGA
ncbi:hypothetical protein ACFQ7I_18635 [Streptomyces massasporeus]